MAVLKLTPHKKEDAQSVSDFLRGIANKIDAGDEIATGAILIIYERNGSEFRTAVRKCNLDFLQEIGLLQTAIFDVQNCAVED